MRIAAIVLKLVGAIIALGRLALWLYVAFYSFIGVQILKPGGFSCS